jgi:hypothetical protein
MWKEAVVALFKILSLTCLERLRKTTKTSVRIAGLRAEILTLDLQDTKQD